METIDKTFRHELSIKDDNFDTENIGNYHLYISVGEDDFRFCIVNPLDNTCLFLENYPFYGKLDVEGQLASLHKIYDNHHFLKANYWKRVSIALRGESFTLVPKELFLETNPDKYLKYSIANPGTKLVFFHEQKSFDAVNVFLVQSTLLNWFKEVYSNVNLNFLHQTGGFIEAIRKQGRSEPKPQPQVHIFVEASYLIIAILKNKTKDLEFCNVFHYKTSQDFVYFLLFVLDELRIDKDTCKIKLYGNIVPNSEIFKWMSRYIHEFVLSDEKPNWLKFNYPFDELANYRFFDLLGMHLCY